MSIKKKINNAECSNQEELTKASGYLWWKQSSPLVIDIWFDPLR